MVNRTDVLQKLNKLCHRFALNCSGCKVTNDNTNDTDYINVFTKRFDYKIRIYTEPVESSYFNMDITAIHKTQKVSYSYLASEVEYNDLEKELKSVQTILYSIEKNKYKIVEKKFFFIIKNIYLVINPSNHKDDSIYLLQTKL